MSRTFWTSLCCSLMLWLWKKKTINLFCLSGGVFHSVTLLCLFIPVSCLFCKWFFGFFRPLILFNMNLVTCKKREENCVRSLHTKATYALTGREWRGTLQNGVEENIWQQSGMRLRSEGLERDKGLCFLEYLPDSSVVWTLLCSGIAFWWGPLWVPAVGIIQFLKSCHFLFFL